MSYQNVGRRWPGVVIAEQARIKYIHFFPMNK